ncbi:MAG: hypothetical protein WCD79_16000 [Chthoniobacteraceae bacterium]
MKHTNLSAAEMSHRKAAPLISGVLAAVASAALLLSQSAQAQPGTIITGTNGPWDTTANWNGGTVASGTVTGAVSIQNGKLAVGNVAAAGSAQALGESGAVNLGMALTSSGTLQYTGGVGTLGMTINALGIGGSKDQRLGNVSGCRRTGRRLAKGRADAEDHQNTGKVVNHGWRGFHGWTEQCEQ